ncbi:Regulatory protein, LuxR [hydrothermal vent metagenome]|uniref:Regulatory protein, LuxR n=1 Tax=hydrothermal vent metagenome TaxID=652676 RepID=A0A3B0WZQ3_9ZZZZ
MVSVVESRDRFLLLTITLIVAISACDIAADLSHGTPVQHVFQELTLLFLSLCALFWLIIGLRKQQREISDLKQALQKTEQSQHQPEQYVLEARKKLADVISQQFNDWLLSRSEQEVGWLLIKGLSLKEIAALRETREKTVRQQASSIYKKADISGRHAFSAWFIEDIL